MSKSKKVEINLKAVMNSDYLSRGHPSIIVDTPFGRFRCEVNQFFPDCSSHNEIGPQADGNCICGLYTISTQSEENIRQGIARNLQKDGDYLGGLLLACGLAPQMFKLGQAYREFTRLASINIRDDMAKFARDNSFSLEF